MAMYKNEQTWGELVLFYPRHIEKEDRQFFKSSMENFSPEELQAMSDEFSNYDRTMIHENTARSWMSWQGSSSPSILGNGGRLTVARSHPGWVDGLGAKD